MIAKSYWSWSRPPLWFQIIGSEWRCLAAFGIEPRVFGTVTAAARATRQQLVLFNSASLVHSTNQLSGANSAIFFLPVKESKRSYERKVGIKENCGLEQKWAKQTQWRPAPERARDSHVPARSKNEDVVPSPQKGKWKRLVLRLEDRRKMNQQTAPSFILSSCCFLPLF